MMRRLFRWLRSSWVCKKCGKEFHMMSFGCGEVICPSCYDGEQPFLFPDKTFLLNRLIAHGKKVNSLPELNVIESL